MLSGKLDYEVRAKARNSYWPSFEAKLAANGSVDVSNVYVCALRANIKSNYSIGKVFLL